MAGLQALLVFNFSSYCQIACTKFMFPFTQARPLPHGILCSGACLEEEERL